MKPLDCMDIYDDAEFYDQEFANRGHEIPFFLKQAKLAGGPVLEVACGTGRITLPIARAGVEIAGLDISRPMLERARRKAEAEHLAFGLVGAGLPRYQHRSNVFPDLFGHKRHATLG